MCVKILLCEFYIYFVWNLDAYWLQIVSLSTCSGSYAFVYFAEKLLVLLRDNRKLLGILRSFDQFGNLLLLLAAYSCSTANFDA